MKKVKGISLTLCTDEEQLWWDGDSDLRGTKPGFGIILSIRIGKVMRPFSFGDGNPWSDPGKAKWVLRIPIFIMPFLSVAIGQYGFYIGGKVYGVDQEHYKNWTLDSDVAPGNTAICPSVSIRKTRLS